MCSGAPCCAMSRLDSLQFVGRAFAALYHHLVSNLLAFRERFHARSLDGTLVHEHVFIAVFGLNESESLGVIEEFYSSGSHVWPPYIDAAQNRARLTNNLIAVGDLNLAPQRADGWLKAGQNVDR